MVSLLGHLVESNNVNLANKVHLHVEEVKYLRTVLVIAAA